MSPTLEYSKEKPLVISPRGINDPQGHFKKGLPFTGTGITVTENEDKIPKEFKEKKTKKTKKVN